MVVTADALPRLDLTEIEREVLDPTVKGMPFAAPPMPLSEIGVQGWNMLNGDLPFPIAVIRQDVLTANSAWMRAFTEENGLKLAPHGKTTMAPHLHDLQIADGAWAITVATVQQLLVARKFKTARVVLANQPIGRLAIDACFDVLTGADPVELYCLADSVDVVAALAEGAARNAASPKAPLRVLVEIGFAGGRTGARNRDDAMKIAQAVAAAPGLDLAGIECFEGVLPDPDAAGRLMDEVIAVGGMVHAAGLLADGTPLILSAGGSSFFDRVGEKLNDAAIDRPILRVLRSGCYLTHDVMGYARAFERIQKETSLRLPPGGLNPALEVWALVQSRLDTDKAILTMGKRDAGTDAGLPHPMFWYRADGTMDGPARVPDGHAVQALNDQHCHLTIPPDSPLAVGDMVGFGIGHPCTTFDKWSLMMLVDDAYTVTGAIRTFF